MDTLKFIADCLAQTHLRLAATCEGLTAAQMAWRPAPTANNIGFILWHVCRNEDSRITATAARQPADASAPFAADLWVADPFAADLWVADPFASDLWLADSFAADLWVADGWHLQFGQPPQAPDPGDRQGLHQLHIPPPNVLLAYAEAVNRRTAQFLSKLPPAALDAPISPTQPPQTIGGSLRHLIVHKNNHHGQIDYLRGLQESDWDLPRGAGAILPPP